MTGARLTSEQTAANDTMPHTPGPWGYCYDGSSTWSVGQESDPQDMPPYVCIMDRNDRRAQANARLIATVPDLLALAKQYASECSGCDGTGKSQGFRGDAGQAQGESCMDCADIRAVINKAEGRV